MSQTSIDVGIFWFKISSGFQIAARNGLHISEVTLRHFIEMFLKVPTLEEFKLSIDYFTISFIKAWEMKIWCYSYSFACLFQPPVIAIFSYSVIYRITMRIIRHTVYLHWVRPWISETCANWDRISFSLELPY